MFEKVVVALVVARGAVACMPTTTTPVPGPDGEDAQLVRCSNSEDCYTEAQETCHGSYQILDSGDRNSSFVTAPQTHTTMVPGPHGTMNTVVSTTPGAVVSNNWHEVLVRCGSSSHSSSQASEGTPSVAAEPKPSADAPKNAAGFAFGKTLEETQSLCTNSSYDWKVAKTTYTCSGTPVDTGLNAHARLSFCDDRLCRIDIVVLPTDSKSTPSANIERAVTTLTKRYGLPAERDVVYGPSCVGAALNDCLVEGTAHFFYEWRWVGKKKITLSLGPRKPRPEGAVVNPVTAGTIRIRYDDGQKLSKSSARGAAENTAPGAEIDGL